MLAILLVATIYAMPNPERTPGEVRPLTLETICKTKWGKDYRPVSNKMKLRVCRSYGLKDCAGYVVDHLIPRELGGADTIRNLWPGT